MAWLTRVGDEWHSTDDLTIDELAAIEKVSGVGWGFTNPIRNAATARALLATWLVRGGASDEDAQKAISAMTNRTLKNTFQYVGNDDLPEEWEDGLPSADPKDPALSSTDTS